jgi:CDP-diglyceride synthetase
MEQEQLTIRQAIGVGAKIGFLPVFFILLFILLQSEMDDLFFILLVGLLGLGVILFGIIGAVAGYALGKTRVATTISAILGTIIGSFGGAILLLTILPE